MNLRGLLSLARSFAIVRLAGGRAPVFASWAITDRCDRRCRYCRVWKRPSREIGVTDGLRILEGLVQAGLVKLGITGGEPLLRDDLEEILRGCAGLGLKVHLNTSGFLVGRLERVVGLVESVTLSLDGGRDVHDRLRGHGAYDAVEAAARVVTASGRSLQVTAVLTRKNLHDVQAVLDFCSRHGATASFHPVYAGNRLWPASTCPLSADGDEYREVFGMLADLKRRGDTRIRDSLAVLRHLRRWPGPARIPCFAGRLFLRITPEGEFVACSWRISGTDACVTEPAVDPLERGVGEALSGLRCQGCDGCFNPSVAELNLAAAGHPDAVTNLLLRRG